MKKWLIIIGVLFVLSTSLSSCYVGYPGYGYAHPYFWGPWGGYHGYYRGGWHGGGWGHHYGGHRGGYHRGGRGR